jgi:branched-chain amino acid transport system substrate-binding protein
VFKLAVAGLLIGALVVGCFGGDDDNDNIQLQVKLAIVQSLTGNGGVYGRSGVEGMELAIKELAISDPGITITYEIADDGSSVQQGVAAYEAFVRDGVTAIIGPSLSTIGFEVLKVAQDASLPAISPMTTAAGITDIGDYVFRIALAEEASLPALVHRVAEITSISSAVLFFDGDDAYSRSGADALRIGIEAIGGIVTLEVDLSETGALEDALEGEAVGEADVFLIPAFTETAAPVLVALRDAGHDQPAIGGEAMASLDLARLAGNAAEGVYVASTWHPDATNELSQRFVTSYRSAYGHEPEHFAAESYTAVYVLVDALKRAGTTDAAELREAIAATTGLNTILGSLSIAASGDASFEPVFQQFRNGALVVIK